jgi:hypothetical protein
MENIQVDTHQIRAVLFTGYGCDAGDGILSADTEATPEI